MRQKLYSLSGTAMRVIGVFSLSAALISGGAHAQSPSTGATLPGTPGSKAVMQNVPRLEAKGILTVTGTENWEEMTGFGKDSRMAEMMTLMMVGGSGMEHMKMGAIKPGMKMGSGAPAMPEAQGLPVAVTLTPNPPIVGNNILDVLVTDAAGKPVNGLKLSAAVAMTNMDMGTGRPKVEEGKDGHYAITVNFGMKGPWRVVLLSDTKGGYKANAVRTTLDFNVDGKTMWTQTVGGGQASGWQLVLNTKSDAVKVGMTTLDVTVLDPAGKPVTGAKVSGAVEMTSMDMGIKRPQSKEGSAGHYLTDVNFSMKGPWRVTLTVTPSGQKPFIKTFDFKVAQ